SVQKSVLDDMHIVELNRIKELGTLRSNVARFKCQVFRQLALDFEIPVLNVRVDQFIRKTLDRLLPVCQRDWLQWLVRTLWNGQREVCQVEKIGLCLNRKKVHTREIAHGTVQGNEGDRADIVDSIPRA